MRKIGIGIVLCALAASAWALTHFARGAGVVEGGSFAGAHFELMVQAPESASNPNRFVFWDQGMFIPVDIVMSRVTNISFSGNRVTFAGPGTYNVTTPVWITVTATDGGRANPDTLTMVAYNGSRQIVHSANGPLEEGDIVVGISR